MNVDLLIELYPRLYHMAAEGSWEAIREHGLLSTSALLDLHGYAGDARAELESCLRPESVSIESRVGTAIIRDQKPMKLAAMRKCLVDVSPEEWLEILNSRSFFWLTKARLNKLLGGRAYRRHPQVVLTVDTESLVSAYADRIQLSPINSGAMLYDPQKRGRDLFKSIADYPYAERRRGRTVENALVELVVVDGVPDIAKHVVCVHDYAHPNFTEIWRRRGSSAADPLDRPWS